MAKKTVKLPSMSRVVAGSIALLEVPIKPTYHNIRFVAAGTALAVAHIKRINVVINGNVVQTFKDLQRLIDLNAYYGRSADTVNDFMLHFKRDEFNELAFKRAPAFGTADLSTFTIELELSSSAPSDITLSAEAFIDTVPQPLGVFTRIREVGISSSVTGVVETDKLQKNQIYQAIHLFKADISKIELEIDQVKVLDSTKANLERLEKSVRPVARVPQTAKATHIDFLLEGDAGDVLNTQGVSDWRLKMTFDTTGAADIVTETLDTL